MKNKHFIKCYNLYIGFRYCIMNGISYKKGEQLNEYRDIDLNKKYEYFGKINRNLFTKFTIKGTKKVDGKILYQKIKLVNEKNVFVSIIYYKVINKNEYIVIITDDENDKLLNNIEDNYLKYSLTNSKNILEALNDYKMSWSFFSERIVFDSLKAFICSKKFCQLYGDKITSNIMKMNNKVEYQWDDEKKRNVAINNPKKKGTYYIEEPFKNKNFLESSQDNIICDIYIHNKNDKYIMKYSYESYLQDSINQGTKFYTCLQHELKKLNKNLDNIKINRAYHEKKIDRLAIHYI